MVYADSFNCLSVRSDSEQCKKGARQAYGYQNGWHNALSRSSWCGIVRSSTEPKD